MSTFRVFGLVAVACAAFVSGCTGLFIGHAHRLPGQPPFSRVRAFPLPHHLPKYKDGVSLRFAMVHDVIHERFPRHGEAYYRERNRLARQVLAEKREHLDDAYFSLCDDLGAGLGYLHQNDEAVRVFRDKLAIQQRLGHKGRQLYTTYANLGTFLIHGSARAARSGHKAAKERLREGLSFIHQSIEVNPEAHFGREAWQAVAVEYLLAVIDKPSLLLQYDMVGNRLSGEVDLLKADSIKDSEQYGFGGFNRDAERAMRDEILSQDRRNHVRYNIAKVGAAPGWKEAVPSSHREPVPFDEPTLGIIGMWRLGGGANPHFALGLGEIMLRVGQRYIAWCAFERAAVMADRVWPDAAIQRQFAEHCRRRQQLIEQQLPTGEVEQLRPRFTEELAYGQHYQREYQAYEGVRIRDGAPLDDPHFYDAFHAIHPPIASPVGREERFVAVLGASYSGPYLNWPVAVFAAGVGACLAAGLVRLVEAFQRRRYKQLGGTP